MKKILLIFLIVIALIWIVGLFFRQQPDMRSLVYFPDMYDSPAYATQSVNPVLPDGKTQQQPVRGTIQRGRLPLHYGAGEPEAVRAGQELSMPFDSVTSQHNKRGQQVYTVFCAPCHGIGGRGDGPVSRRGYPPPPSLFLQNAMEMPDGQMFHILTYGQKNMPGYAAQVSRADRWKTVVYIRRLQEQYLEQQTQQAEQEQTE